MCQGLAHGLTRWPKSARWMVVEWVNGWDEMMVLTRVVPRANKMIEKTAVKRAGYMAVHWVG